MKTLPKNFVIGFSALMLLSFLGSCALDPLSWIPPDLPAESEATAENNLLQTTEWLDLDGWYGPEDIAVRNDGVIFCGAHSSKNDFSNGRILQISQTGEVSTFCNTESWVTGLHFDAAGNLIACDQKRGLISVNLHGEITVLAQKDEQDRPFLLVNDVDIASDGMIYFSNTSSKLNFSPKNARKLLLEVRPDGGLYSYNPISGEVNTLIDSSFFGNGVAVSKNDEFVLMVDLTKYRIVRYWLKGEEKGTIDCFIDNLPGLPNGISRREDGSFWLGFTTHRMKALDKLQPRVGLKKFVFGLPTWLQPKQDAFGIVMHLSASGEILKTYYDPTGKVVPEASSIEEKDGKIYLGGDLTDHIGVFQLPIE